MKWYHISYSWKDPEIQIDPRVGRIDDEFDARELIPFIAVCPSIEQCIVAIGDWRYLGEMNVYETDGFPEKCGWVFDFDITEEHRFRISKTFKLVKKINFTEIGKNIPERETFGISDEEILENIKKDLEDIRKNFTF